MLALAEGDEILQIERVRLADAEPLAVEVLYLDARRFDDVAALLGESQSLYQLLRARYGVELAWAEETIEAVVAPEREASLLGIASGGPVLLLCRQSFDPIGTTDRVRPFPLPCRPFPLPYPLAAPSTDRGRGSPRKRACAWRHRPTLPVSPASLSLHGGLATPGSWTNPSSTRSTRRK